MTTTTLILLDVDEVLIRPRGLAPPLDRWAAI